MLDIFILNIKDCARNNLLQRFSFLKSIRYKLLTIATLLVFMTVPSYAQVFSLTSVPDNFTAVYTDTVDVSRTITVTLEPENTACASFDATGRATVFATNSNSVCDRSIAINFQTSGFALESIAFNDIDDIDGIAPRDSFSANVPGTWTSPTIEVHTFASPPTFANQAVRLSNAGGIGTFLANTAGNNPTNETATFQLTDAATSITIYFDDVEGARNAQAFFSLDPIGASINVNSDLVTSKILASGNNEPVEGEVVTFQIDVTNNGPADANSITLRDELPDGLIATAANGGATLGSYDVLTGIWTIADLPNGMTASLTIEGTVDTGRGGQLIQNTTTRAIGDEPDPTNSGDDLDESVNITSSIDLVITKTNTPGVNGEVDQASDTLVSGTTTTYTLTVTNNGPDTAVGAVVSDVIDSGLTCDSSNIVTITGDGVPSGSFSVADLTGAGIILGTLTISQSTILSYDCLVN